MLPRRLEEATMYTPGHVYRSSRYLPFLSAFSSRFFKCDIVFLSILSVGLEGHQRGQSVCHARFCNVPHLTQEQPN